MTWTGPVLSLGFIVALVVLIVDIILKMMGLIDLPAALLIAAVTSVRL